MQFFAVKLSVMLSFSRRRRVDPSDGTARVVRVRGAARSFPRVGRVTRAMALLVSCAFGAPIEAFFAAWAE